MTVFAVIKPVSRRALLKLRLNWLKKALLGKRVLLKTFESEEEFEREIRRLYEAHRKLEVFVASGNRFERRRVERLEVEDEEDV